MHTPVQHIFSATAADVGLGCGDKPSVIDQCIAELRYSQVVLKAERLRLLGQGVDFLGLEVSAHD